METKETFILNVMVYVFVVRFIIEPCHSNVVSLST